jgi:hypothetical protein
MEFTPTILLCGAVLIAAAPAWADRIPYPGSAKESPSAVISVKMTRSSVLKKNAPVNGEFRSEPSSMGGLANSFEANNTFGAQDAKSSIAPSTFFPWLSEINTHHDARPSDRDSDERISSIWRAGKAWGKESAGNRENDTERIETRKDLLPASLPEPGSLPLLLLGLLALGFSARRRLESTMTI